MTSWAERQRDADATWRHERMTAETVPCPRCHVGIGETCTNPYTGEAFKRAPAHWQRIWAVEHGTDLDTAAEETQG